MRTLRPLAEIVSIYIPALRERDIKTNYDPNSETFQNLNKLQRTLDEDINQVRAELGLENIKPINLSPEKAEQLRHSIKSHPRWKKHYNDLVAFLEPKSHLQDTYDDLFLPWWNEVIFNFKDETYSDTVNLSLPSFQPLIVNFTLSHSYIGQLKSKEHLKSIAHPLSISGVLTTSDNALVLGFRKGPASGKTYMSLPAGYLGSSLFESFYTELKEELDIGLKDLNDFGLISRVIDYSLQLGKPRSYFTFAAKTKFSYEDLVNCWGSSVDRNEHFYLGVFPDDADKMLHRIKAMSFDLSKEQDFRKIAIPENFGSILPSCAASILAFYTFKKGKEWAKHAEDFLEGEYKMKY